MALKTKMATNTLRRKDRALEEMTGPQFKAAFGETKTEYRNSRRNKMFKNKMTANRGGMPKKNFAKPGSYSSAYKKGGMTMRKGNMAYKKGGVAKKK